MLPLSAAKGPRQRAFVRNHSVRNEHSRTSPGGDMRNGPGHALVTGYVVLLLSLGAWGNVIEDENAKSGTPDWPITQWSVDEYGRSEAIEGYCSELSYEAGDTLTVYVSTNPAFGATCVYTRPHARGRPRYGCSVRSAREPDSRQRCSGGVYPVVPGTSRCWSDDESGKTDRPVTSVAVQMPQRCPVRADLYACPWAVGFSRASRWISSSRRVPA